MKTLVLAAWVVVVFGQQSSPRIAPLPKEFHDPLLDATSVIATENASLSAEPGVRFSVSESIFRLATYDCSQIEFQSDKGYFRVHSPAEGKLTSGGFEINGVNHPANSMFVARRVVQDDTDTNLKSMQESAKKLKSKTNDKQEDTKGTTKKLKVRWLYGENPNPTAELFNGPAIQQLTHLSAIGF